MPAKSKLSHKDRLLSMVTIVDSGCWDFNGYLDRKGYGKFKVEKRMLLAHRVSYQLLVGDFDKCLTIDHLCRNRKCVNPAHLEPVTLIENIRRKPVFTHCRNGHELTKKNIYPGRGTRDCRKCICEAQKRYKRRNNTA